VSDEDEHSLSEQVGQAVQSLLNMAELQKVLLAFHLARDLSIRLRPLFQRHFRCSRHSVQVDELEMPSWAQSPF
jgi:hypothetical protein